MAQGKSAPHPQARWGFESPCPFNVNEATTMKTIEQQVADAILERPSDVLTVGDRKFPIAPPTPATLIMISSLVSTMPAVNRKARNIIVEVFGKAKDLSVIGRIVATMILGAKRIREERTVKVTHTEYVRRWSWRRLRSVSEERAVTDEVPEIEWLSDKLLDEVTPQTLLKLTAKRIGLMQIPDFFELTTSLSETNLTRRTKEVEETAFGA